MEETTVNTSVDTGSTGGGDTPAVDTPTAPAPAPAPPAETLPSAPVQQVVSVDELIDRLTGGADSSEDSEGESAEQPEAVEGEEAEPSLSDRYFTYVLEDTTNKEILQMVTEIREEVKLHPAMTTDFEDYTVSEGLMLLLFLSVFGSWLVRLVRGGISWLLW